MTGKELLDITEEILQLKRALGLIPPRVIHVPKGTSPTTCRSGTAGRCVVCDKEYTAEDTIRRCCKEVTTVNKRGNKVTSTVGLRVCFRCSPYIWDWQLNRYAQPVESWPEHWKQGTDTGVFGSKTSRTRSVFELDLREKTEDEQYLEDKIAKIEAQIKREQNTGSTT